MLLAIVPLLTLLLAVAQGQERVRMAVVGGTVIAFVGVAVMSRAPVRESVPPLTLLAALGAALCFAEAAVLVRSVPPVHPIAMNAMGMAAAAVFLPYAIVLGRWSASRASYLLVLVPVITVVLSAWLDDEPIGLGLVLGGVMVLAGVYLGALRPAYGR